MLVCGQHGESQELQDEHRAANTGVPFCEWMRGRLLTKLDAHFAADITATQKPPATLGTAAAHPPGATGSITGLTLSPTQDGTVHQPSPQVRKEQAL